MPNSIYKQLTEIFRDLFDDDSIILTPDTTAMDIPDWDSLLHISLIVAVEGRFGVKFKTAELEALHNVGDLAGLIEQKTRRTATA
jgi:acyl carrier protein